jgi:hypothetical protein
MSESQDRNEQRVRVRQSAPAKRISWVQKDASRTHVGWVNDADTAGIAFVTPTRDKPSPGESIELTFGPQGPSPRHSRVRVIHTTPYDRFFSIVGCQTEPQP